MIRVKKKEQLGIRRGGERKSITVIQREHADGQHAHEKYIQLLIVKENKAFKATMSYHLMLVRMAIIKKSTNNN